ncbi:MAG: hypothetical protein JSR09_05925 [Bacteroidetes bacterium]|nr:hypothetical protein [Bacteroidota bacterium]MBS1649228.1 hypothetical protein [Bacteroidota bacterium]
MLAVYKENFQQEKIHIHFDRNIYKKGETIWYKAYLLTGNDLSDYSRNFYVDWYDNQGRLIKHTIAPIFQSSARGQFEIPENYMGEWLHVKAYTKWMLNFDTAFLYNNDIRIYQINNNVQVKANIIPTTSINFFPEGGDIIAGTTANIAFLANDKNGKPVNVRGAIFNSKKQLIDSFLSIHDGMGSFTIDAEENESYTCNWVDEFGIHHTNNLPAVKNNGIAINMQQLDTKVMYVLSKNKQETNEFKKLYVIGLINQQEVYSVKINFSTKQKVVGEINTEQMPTGLLQVTVFDADWVPVAERVLFVNNHQYEFFPDVNITKGLGKREKNILEIKVADTILSNMSVAVTDADFVVNEANNIFSELLLTGNLKGYIHNPMYYFSNYSDSVKKHLDLVMLTHGWRKYNWQDIITNKTPKIDYPKDSDYLQIKGRLSANDKQQYDLITVIMQSKDSSKQYLVIPVAKDGSFNQRGVIFFDTVKVFYHLPSSKNKINNDLIAVKMENGLQIIPFAKTIQPKLPSIIWNYSIVDSQLIAKAKAMAAENERLQKIYEGSKLKEVTVYAKIKSATELLDEKYTTGIFSASNNAYTFDIGNDDRALASLDILHYLQGQIPGLSMSITFLGANGTEDANSSNSSGLNWRDGTPDIFLNEMPSDVNTIQDLQMSDVAYIKVFKPPFMAASGSGASGAIAVYTKKPSEIKEAMRINKNYILLQGYTPIKEFYNPNYSITQTALPDTRSTIYWNPYVLTDKKNKLIKLEFYNNDISKKLRIIVEGVNAAGQLARIEKVVE